MARKKFDQHAEVPRETLENLLTKSFQNRSEGVQEIISRQPGFVEKWALLFFMGVLLLMLGGTWFIRYPDIIQARGTLTANNAPKEIIPLQTGRLVKLYVKSGQEVQKGDMIGWLESTADTEEIIALSKQLNSSLVLLSEGKAESLSRLFKERYQQLGELQASYQTFSAALEQFNDYLVNGFYLRRKDLILRDIASIKEMNLSLQQQKELTQRDTEISRKSFEMNDLLLQQKVISPEEHRNAQSRYVNKQMSIPQLNTSILSNLSASRDKLKELEQLDHDVALQKITFEQALHTLKSNVDEWLHRYTLQAPLNGTVFFTGPLQVNQFVNQGKVLGYINPPNSTFYAEINLPQNNFGKVDTGMQVQLRFDAYPYQEAGFVKGKLDYISRVASDSGFLATVRLDSGLLTNLNRDIPYKGGLKLDAIVVTKNMRLLSRMYHNVVKSASVGK